LLAKSPTAPRNFKLDDLQPLQSPVSGTTANLTGCLIYAPKHAKSAGSAKTGSRIAMLLLGWLFFAIFWLFIASVAWYVLSMISFLLLLGLALVTHTPGFRDLFREALFRLKS
jgi:hypothetical protein